MDNEEIDRRASEKALALLNEKRLSDVEDKVLVHETVLMVGNGEPSVRTDLRELKTEVPKIRDEVHAMQSQLSDLHRWSEERRAAQASSRGWRDKALEFALKPLMQAAIIGLIGWIAWSIKTYVETTQ